MAANKLGQAFGRAIYQRTKEQQDPDLNRIVQQANPVYQGDDVGRSELFGEQPAVSADGPPFSMKLAAGEDAPSEPGGPMPRLDR